MTQEYKFEVTVAERTTYLYRKLIAHLDRTIAIERAKNDGNLGIDETNRLRGRIACAKKLKEELEYVTPAPEDE